MNIIFFTLKVVKFLGKRLYLNIVKYLFGSKPFFVFRLLCRFLSSLSHVKSDQIYEHFILESLWRLLAWWVYGG